MTKPSSIKTAELENYDHLDIHQLEAILSDIQKSTPSAESKHTARVIRQSLSQRQRFIKAQVMEFEQTNDHHLLIFDSTESFSKLAGHSVLFYTMTIADRIHRRFSVKNDTDNYSPSNDGVVSIRSLDQLETQLAEINVFPDRERSTTELHFYKLPKIYTEEQIEKLRDRSHRDVERITSTIIPKSPLPELYNLILELNRQLYYNCKRVSDSLARDTLVKPLIVEANELLVGYLNFANTKATSGIIHPPLQHLLAATNAVKPHTIQAQNLLGIMIGARNLRNNLANMENLRLIHHRDLCNILENLVHIEHITAREYNKQQQHSKRHEQ